MTEDDQKLPFLEHLEELRTRLIRCFIAVGVGFGIAYFFKEDLFQILIRHLSQGYLGDIQLAFLDQL